jgi:hypothetical protein
MEFVCLFFFVPYCQSDNASDEYFKEWAFLLRTQKDYNC